ncbi:glycosyltransferase family 4 protein [Geothrix terrae]|uniref:glycosyltransferase family 4 protein n=1 Tax=Geothrix terrae TaxID=2922720 RepID=UPI0030844842
MKVVMACWRFHPHAGGVERHVLEVSRRLMRRGHEVVVVTEAHEPGLPAGDVLELPEGRLEIRRVPRFEHGRASFLRPAWWRGWAGARAAFREAGLLHFHDYPPFLYWFLPVRWLFPGKPAFVTFHGWEGACPPDPRVVRIRRWVERWTRGNICVGAFIPVWYGTRCRHLTYGGVEAPSRAAAEGSEGTSSLVFLGRLAEDTGVRQCLEASALLQRQGLGFPLTLCGDGPLRAELEARAAGLGLQAKFLGWVREPARELAHAKLVFTSGYLAILEAMAQGKVVCATYDNPLKEDYLRLFPEAESRMVVAGDAESLATRMAGLLADPGRLQIMGEDARAWALTQTWDRVADLYEDLWGRG